MKLHYYDGTERIVDIIDQEVTFPDGRLIVSRTNMTGIMTHFNQSFIDMSGYSKEELMGKSHCILRHPDMPAAAFKGLWDTVQQGNKWHGYVKNLRKDGLYYWVYAVVIPNIRQNKIVGYTSVRRKPSRKKIEECILLYAEMLKKEETQSCPTH
ncbi:MAG: PAS domain-containing protein [Cocleimonas sp.]|nr:PAS domain-containing protein [Cocleimonas sp.]